MLYLQGRPRSVQASSVEQPQLSRVKAKEAEILRILAIGGGITAENFRASKQEIYDAVLANESDLHVARGINWFGIAHQPVTRSQIYALISVYTRVVGSTPISLYRLESWVTEAFPSTEGFARVEICGGRSQVYFDEFFNSAVDYTKILQSQLPSACSSSYSLLRIRAHVSPTLLQNVVAEASRLLNTDDQGREFSIDKLAMIAKEIEKIPFEKRADVLGRAIRAVRMMGSNVSAKGRVSVIAATAKIPTESWDDFLSAAQRFSANMSESSERVMVVESLAQVESAHLHDFEEQFFYFLPSNASITMRLGLLNKCAQVAHTGQREDFVKGAFDYLLSKIRDDDRPRVKALAIFPEHKEAFVLHALSLSRDDPYVLLSDVAVTLAEVVPPEHWKIFADEAFRYYSADEHDFREVICALAKVPQPQWQKFFLQLKRIIPSKFSRGGCLRSGAIVRLAGVEPQYWETFITQSQHLSSGLKEYDFLQVMDVVAEIDDDQIEDVVTQSRRLIGYFTPVSWRLDLIKAIARIPTTRQRVDVVNQAIRFMKTFGSLTTGFYEYAYIIDGIAGMPWEEDALSQAAQLFSSDMCVYDKMRIFQRVIKIDSDKRQQAVDHVLATRPKSGNDYGRTIDLLKSS